MLGFWYILYIQMLEQSDALVALGDENVIEEYHGSNCCRRAG
ncbi:hypothetical protein THF1C08_180063 [Vibrio jasicida]|uniref:Uncharacterized protein n=1 Tax=Vibrio jasicida TaxID=766224 RepID=A0AAU9QK54_9VIBR|nr:hypothetical protein THF1C08_180063 [Vibrio jasicida]CAH1581574.1 hypothetical protein THF1A12_170063 [Vibrio jasicida]